MTNIAHASVPADDPRQTATVLAKMMGGEAVRFPPGGPEAWMAWSRDGSVHLEIVPRGNVLCRDTEQGVWQSERAEERRSEVHLAICVERPETEILALAEEAGWPARHCERGGGVFSLAEIWVDDCFMIEILDPEQTRTYRERITLTNWKAYLPMMEGAA